MNENFDSFNRLSVLLVICLDRSKVLILVLERSDFKYLLSTKLRGLSLPGPVGGTRVSGLSDFTVNCNISLCTSYFCFPGWLWTRNYWPSISFTRDMYWHRVLSSELRSLGNW